MDRRPTPANPETLWYEARLRRRRWSQRGVAVVRASLGALLLVFTLTHSSLHQPAPPGVYVLFAAVYAVFALPIVYGVRNFVATLGPISRSEVDRLRSRERAQLYQQAQGNLPWQLRRWALLVELALGLCLLFLTGLVTTHADSVRAQWEGGVLFFVPALALVVDALAIKPRRARRLAEASAAELSFRLAAGEFAGAGDEPPQPAV